MATNKKKKRSQIGSNPFAKTGKKQGVKPAINVTPLVDVVLVLLIISMVVLPSVQDYKSIEMVELDEADETQADGEEEPFTITVIQDGDTPEFTFGENDCDRDTLLAWLGQGHDQDPERRVLLRVDARVKHKHVRALIKDIQDLEIGGIAFAVAGKSEDWEDGEGTEVAAAEGEG